MANIQPKFVSPFAKEDFVKPIFYHANEKITKFVRDFDKSLQIYNTNISKYDSEHKETEIDTKITTHLYEWANLNAQNDDSVKNWKNLYHGEVGKSIKNEGSVFKEITMTADLLKQMKLIAQTGMELSQYKEDFQYYNKLSANIDEALSLICRTPVEI